MIRKIIAIAALGFLLSGCVNGRSIFDTWQNPVTQSRIDKVNAGWGTALSLANGYRETCIQRIIPSSCREVVRKMQAVVPSIHAKVVRARAFAKNPTISTIDLVQVASDAVNDFKVMQMQLGVK